MTGASQGKDRGVPLLGNPEIVFCTIETQHPSVLSGKERGKSTRPHFRWCSPALLALFQHIRLENYVKDSFVQKNLHDILLRS